MSPKKRKRHKTQPGSDQHSANGWEPGRIPPGHTPDQRPISRTPLKLTSPPDRRVSILWVTLWTLWALGSPLALVALLFAGLNAFEAVADPTSAPDQALLIEQERQAIRSIGNALLWFLAMAWLVPAAGALTAAVLRRKMAAIAFTSALALSVGLLLLVISPVELWGALSTHLFG